MFSKKNKPPAEKEIARGKDLSKERSTPPRRNKRMQRSGVMGPSPIIKTSPKKSSTQSEQKESKQFLEKKRLTIDDYQVNLQEIKDPLLRSRGERWAWEVEGREEYKNGVAKRKRQAERAIRKFISETEYKNREKDLKDKEIALISSYTSKYQTEKTRDLISRLEKDQSHFFTKEFVGDYLLVVSYHNSRDLWHSSGRWEASALSSKGALFIGQRLKSENTKDALKEAEKFLKEAVVKRQFSGPRHQ